MKCVVHPESDAAAYCRNCGKPMCADCKRDVRGVLYCENCLAALVSGAPAAHVHTASPAVAAVLGFIPGLGAVFNGEYVKAIIHIAVFAGIIAMLNNPLSQGMQVFLGISLGCFYLYMPIEAYRTARTKQIAAHAVSYPASGPAVATGPAAASFAGAPPAPVAAPAQTQPHRHYSPVTGAVILIVLGVLVLLSNLGLLEGEWFGHWWPAILVGIGIWLLWKRFRGPVEKGQPQG
jgi:LiaI-LiaF-like transmembrane region/B-box zinc finger